MSPRAAAAALGVAAGTAFLVRTLSLPSAQSGDSWAYEAWGDSLLRGDAPLYDHARTTPKPLAILLGAIVQPLPPERAMAVPVAVGLALLVGALFTTALRRAGGIAAVVAVVALSVAAPLAQVARLTLIDGVAAGLVALAAALSGRGRVVTIILAGLLRPEAWPLAGLAAFQTVDGTWGRRLRAGTLAALLPAGLWAAIDYAVAGDPLASKRIAETLLPHTVRWLSVPEVFVRGLGYPALAVAAVGAVGLALRARKRAGLWDGDVLFYGAIALVWSSIVAYEVREGLPPTNLARYLLPALAIFALGCGLLVDDLAPRRLARPAAWPAAGLGGVAVAVVVTRMVLGPSYDAQVRRIAAVQDASPVVEQVLDCGRIGLAGSERGVAILPQLALFTGHPLSEFEFRRSGRQYAAVLRVDIAKPQRGMRRAELPSWPRLDTPVGPLAVSPRCLNRIG